MPTYEAKDKATEQMQGDNREKWFHENERGEEGRWEGEGDEEERKEGGGKREG